MAGIIDSDAILQNLNSTNFGGDTKVSSSNFIGQYQDFASEVKRAIDAIKPPRFLDDNYVDKDLKRLSYRYNNFFKTSFQDPIKKANDAIKELNKNFEKLNKNQSRKSSIFGKVTDSSGNQPPNMQGKEAYDFSALIKSNTALIKSNEALAASIVLLTGALGKASFGAGKVAGKTETKGTESAGTGGSGREGSLGPKEVSISSKALKALGSSFQKAIDVLVVDSILNDSKSMITEYNKQLKAYQEAANLTVDQVMAVNDKIVKLTNASNDAQRYLIKDKTSQKTLDWLKKSLPKPMADLLKDFRGGDLYSYKEFLQAQKETVSTGITDSMRDSMTSIQAYLAKSGSELSVGDKRALQLLYTQGVGFEGASKAIKELGTFLKLSKKNYSSDATRWAQENFLKESFMSGGGGAKKLGQAASTYETLSAFGVQDKFGSKMKYLDRALRGDRFALFAMQEDPHLAQLMIDTFGSAVPPANMSMDQIASAMMGTLKRASSDLSGTAMSRYGDSYQEISDLLWSARTTDMGTLNQAQADREKAMQSFFDPEQALKPVADDLEVIKKFLTNSVLGSENYKKLLEQEFNTGIKFTAFTEELVTRIGGFFIGEFLPSLMKDLTILKAGGKLVGKATDLAMAGKLGSTIAAGKATVAAGATVAAAGVKMAMPFLIPAALLAAKKYNDYSTGANMGVRDENGNIWYINNKGQVTKPNEGIGGPIGPLLEDFSIPNNLLSSSTFSSELTLDTPSLNTSNLNLAGSPQTTKFVAPISSSSSNTFLGYGITSKFGPRWGRLHKGIDLAFSTGQEIPSFTDGRVGSAGWQSGFGNWVEIIDPNGFYHLYAHMDRPSLVRAGEPIRQGQLIGYAGSTGRSTGPHLHYQISRRPDLAPDYDYIDPLLFWSGQSQGRTNFALLKGESYNMPSAVAGDIGTQAWIEAQRIGRDLGVNPALIYGQWFHETGGFKSRLTVEDYNFGGQTTKRDMGPEYKQPDGAYWYMHFNSAGEYADYFKKHWGSTIQGTTSPEDYALRLKNERYYDGSKPEYYTRYVAGIYNGMRHIPGAAGSLYSGSPSYIGPSGTVPYQGVTYPDANDYAGYPPEMVAASISPANQELLNSYYADVFGDQPMTTRGMGGVDSPIEDFSNFLADPESTAEGIFGAIASTPHDFQPIASTSAFLRSLNSGVAPFTGSRIEQAIRQAAQEIVIAIKDPKPPEMASLGTLPPSNYSYDD